MKTTPVLATEERSGISWLTDPAAPASGVRLAFTNRAGGTSEPPFDSLNLSASVGDDATRVLANRNRVMTSVGFSSSALALARQVHGARVLEAVEGDGALIGEGDALIARRRGVAVGVLTADCVPVLLAGPEGVAAVHAGWRGLVAGVIEETLDALPGVERAWIGPGIRACCYDVGPEVEDAFVRRSLVAPAAGRVDPVESAAVILARAGIDAATAAECTSCDERYYSHRRDGVTGRQGGFVEWM